MTATHTGPIPPARRRVGLLAGSGLLAALAVASVALGSRVIPFDDTIAAFTAYDPGNNAHLIIMELRVPRTLLALLVGAALGMAGALMQAMTRNPLAEPGLLGVNAGAAAAVAGAMAVFGYVHIGQYIWFAFAGAGAASALAYALGRANEAGTNPVRLVLAGAGLSTVLAALTTVILLNSPEAVYAAFRDWITGSLQGRGYEALPVATFSVLIGGALAIAMGPALNAMALGGDLGRALGVPVRLVWAGTSAAVLLLAGAATAVAGPIAFIGLVAPHVARAIVGPDYRLILPYSAFFAAILLLGADVLGRVVAPPSEVGAGIMAALIGGPFFVALVRRRKLARL